ncbi:peptidase domain-containing ABC transporter [Halosquirtibacter laminarini]|uniref:Peptidase domain-containing ABC transporter n=1 Tax=Halosquirtibacter laminarini TaxID=3374600 RepID=A0AC61NM06_9BACT|nr:peptidase domain-containing ABC transporter [Prolixibacteraceae bacterium]
MRSIERKRIKKTFVKQLYQSDCGVACLQSILRYHNIKNVSYQDIRTLSGTDRQGTSLLGLYEASKDFGLEAKGLRSSIDKLKESTDLAILHIRKDRVMEHYVVFFGMHKGKFLIGDPAVGVKCVNDYELEKVWMSKKCLRLTRTVSRENSSNSNSPQKSLVINLVKQDLNKIISSAVIGIVVAILSIITALITQKLIDNILPSKRTGELLVIGLLFLFILCFRSFLSYLRASILAEQTKTFNLRIISSFFKSLIELPKIVFDTRAIGDMVVRLNDTVRIQNFITNVIGNSLIDLMMLLTSLAFVLYHSSELFVVSTIIFCIFFIVILSLTKKVLNKQKAIMSSFSQVETNYIDSIQGIVEIKMSNQEEEFSRINKNTIAHNQDKVYDLNKFKAKLNVINGIVTALYLSIVLMFGANKVLSDEMQLGVFMAIFGLCSAAIPFVINLAMIIVPLNEAVSAFNRIYELTNVRAENRSGENVTEFESLEVENLSFNYPGRKRLLNNISFCVRKNELISIVGENGSGKSTITQLICRFYNPKEGRITINNKTDINSLELSQWRNTIGVISQDIHLFNGTIIENIAMSTSPEAINSTIERLKEIELIDLFNQFSDNIWTVVGEVGSNISGGQRQLIGIARALTKKSKLIILDEATSAMDVETETKIINIINTLKASVAFIFISHKVHILKNISDRLYLIDDGAINHWGNHQELMSTKNFYSTFWNKYFDSGFVHELQK